MITKRMTMIITITLNNAIITKKRTMMIMIKFNNAMITTMVTFNICSFSLARRDTEPKTSLKSFRYKFDLSAFAGNAWASVVKLLEITYSSY